MSESSGTPSTNPKDAIGRKKPMLHLIPPSALILESLAMRNGAEKYNPYNWRRATVAATVYVDAVMRHLLAWLDGEENAPDSGIHHLAHARASLGIIIDAQVQGTMVDDRPSANGAAGKASELIENLSNPKRTMNLVQKSPRRSGYVDHTKTASEVNAEYGDAGDENRVLVFDPAVPGADETALLILGSDEQIFICNGDQITGVMLLSKPRSGRVYIAGPMRGYEKFNFPAFDAARNLAVSLGWDPISPADLDRDSGFHEDAPPMQALGPEITRQFVDRDTTALLSLRSEHGDAIALLPGWEKSTGAVAEFFVARWLGLRVLNAQTFEPFGSKEMLDLDLGPILRNVLKTIRESK